MSFRELRNLCEVMRALGYHRLISVENFRAPNFELVADLLDWLLHRLDPAAGLSDDISSEQLRVHFVKCACERVLLKTGLRLNSRKLYGADGHAARELLRLASLLHEAHCSAAQSAGLLGALPGAAAQPPDLRGARSLCSDIVESGAALFELLQNEERDGRAERSRALHFLDKFSQDLASTGEEKAVGQAVERMLCRQGQQLEQLHRASEELRRDEHALQQQIKKKGQELDRSRRRLLSLESVRPAFMDEYEALEQQFEHYYEQYISRFRNLDYLENEVDLLHQREAAQMEADERSLKRMREQLREEEWKMLRGELREVSEEQFREAAEVNQRRPGGHSWLPTQPRQEHDECVYSEALDLESDDSPGSSSDAVPSRLNFGELAAASSDDCSDFDDSDGSDGVGARSRRQLHRQHAAAAGGGPVRRRRKKGAYAAAARKRGARRRGGGQRRGGR